MQRQQPNKYVKTNFGMGRRQRERPPRSPSSSPQPRSSSALAPPQRSAVGNGIGHSAHFDCPICVETFDGPIFQCTQGHVVCSTCLPKWPICSQCRRPYPNPVIRNRVMESVVEEWRNNSGTGQGQVGQQQQNANTLGRNMLTTPAGNVTRQASPEVVWLGDVRAGSSLPSTSRAAAAAAGVTAATRFPLSGAPVHINISCHGEDCKRDRPNMPIIGLRYKCVECKNVNLCEDCEKKGAHDRHIVVRIVKLSQVKKIEKFLGDNSRK